MVHWKFTKILYDFWYSKSYHNEPHCKRKFPPPQLLMACLKYKGKKSFWLCRGECLRHTREFHILKDVPYFLFLAFLINLHRKLFTLLRPNSLNAGRTSMTELYLKRSRLRNGSPKICAQTGSRLSDVAKANPQSSNDEDSSFSALLYVSWSPFCPLV